MFILYFDECAFVIMTIFLASCIVRKEYKTRVNLIMFNMMIMVQLSIIADFVSGAIGNYGAPTEANRIIMYVVNIIYFLTHNMILPIYILYVYNSIDIWHVFKKNNKRSILWFFLVGLNAFIILLNGVLFNVFTIDENAKYVRGPWIAALYVIASIFGIWGFSTIVKYRRFLNKDKLVVLLFLYIVVIAGILAQLLLPTFLLEGFAIALAVLFFMVIVRREETQIDPMTGAFRYNEGIDRITKNFESNKPVSVIFMKIVNYKNLHMYLGLENYNSFLRFTTGRLWDIVKKSEFDADVYYLENGIYALFGDGAGDELLKAVSKECEMMFAKESHFDNFTVMTDVRTCVVNCPVDISDITTFVTLASTFHHTFPNDKKVHFYRDYKDDKEFRVRSELETIIERAINHDGLQMYYQPIYSIREQRYVAAEALIRLHDREYGYVSPAIFIPMAEFSGAIHEIGDFVLKDTIRFVPKIKALGLKYVEINLSASQCIETDLVDKIKRILEENNVSPSSISFELTEAATDLNPEIVDANIKKLHDSGIRIALDDYGTGYSNVKRVTQLPFDQVKLDRSFVNMMEDKDMFIIVKDTINMLKEMGKEILVEGVEQEEMVKKVAELDADLVQGCELVQGFYFCKPLPEEEFVEFIKAHNSKMQEG